MADKAEVKLADFIKSVHAELREKYHLDSDETTVWQSHCQNTKLLDEYAHTMRQLAETWATSNSGQCRIQWCASTIKDYYFKGGKNRALDKDCRKLEYRENDGQSDDCRMQSISKYEANEGDVKILDVGSCFNPLKVFLEFSVLAIDIAPANEDVMRCDFLSVPVISANMPTNVLQNCFNYLEDSHNTHDSSSREVISLTACSFEVVVFSLLLEYLPSPLQRWQSCRKAHDVLANHGLLVIVTPDSHAVHRNAHLMRSWKQTIEAIGFRRWRYEKLEHLHCMAFRKVQRTAVEIADSQRVLHIPQDFTQLKHNFDKTENVIDERTTVENDILCNAFADLPACFS